MPKLVTTYSGNVLTPYNPNVPAPCYPVQLAPSTTYPAGCVLGLITTAANDVQTVTVTGTPTGGTFKLTGTSPVNGETFTTGTIAYNASAATVASAVSAVIGQGVTVTGTGGALPGTAVVLTFAGSVASQPVTLMTVTGAALTGGSTPAATVAHTTTGVSGGEYGTYVDANSDGTGVAKCLLKYPCATDAAGNITSGGASTGDEWGSTERTAPAYFGGIFLTNDITGLDAAAVTDLMAILLWGSVTNGCVKF